MPNKERQQGSGKIDRHNLNPPPKEKTIATSALTLLQNKNHVYRVRTLHVIKYYISRPTGGRIFFLDEAASILQQ